MARCFAKVEVRVTSREEVFIAWAATFAIWRSVLRQVFRSLSGVAVGGAGGLVRVLDLVREVTRCSIAVIILESRTVFGRSPEARGVVDR